MREHHHDDRTGARTVSCAPTAPEEGGHAGESEGIIGVERSAYPAAGQEGSVDGDEGISAWKLWIAIAAENER